MSRARTHPTGRRLRQYKRIQLNSISLNNISCFSLAPLPLCAAPAAAVEREKGFLFSAMCYVQNKCDCFPLRIRCVTGNGTCNSKSAIIDSVPRLSYIHILLSIRMCFIVPSHCRRLRAPPSAWQMGSRFAVTTIQLSALIECLARRVEYQRQRQWRQQQQGEKNARHHGHQQTDRLVCTCSCHTHSHTIHTHTHTVEVMLVVRYEKLRVGIMAGRTR